MAEFLIVFLDACSTTTHNEEQLRIVAKRPIISTNFSEVNESEKSVQRVGHICYIILHIAQWYNANVQFYEISQRKMRNSYQWLVAVLPCSVYMIYMILRTQAVSVVHSE